jgi:hypothetical protein
MRKFFMMLATIGVLALSISTADARLYCYNRYSGAFLHWGPCGGYHPINYYHPGRTYCYNRYTGNFLHWGACY